MKTILLIFIAVCLLVLVQILVPTKQYIPTIPNEISYSEMYDLWINDEAIDTDELTNIPEDIKQTDGFKCSSTKMKYLNHYYYLEFNPMRYILIVTPTEANEQLIKP